MFHRITATFDQGSWERIINTEFLVCIDPYQDEHEMYIRFQLTTEQIAFEYTNLEHMMQDYSRLANNLGQEYTNVHTIITPKSCKEL